MSITYTEENYENLVIELFKELEYTHIYGPNIDTRNFYSPFYEHQLIESLSNIKIFILDFVL